jgi:hypothetical protein
MTRFAGLKDDLPPQGGFGAGRTGELPPASAAMATSDGNSKRKPAREGKKGVLGHFSPELSRALNIMAIEEGTTVQALMGEAFDLLMRARGKHPFGER